MNLFEILDTIDEEVATLKDKTDINEALALNMSQTGGIGGGIGFGQMHHEGASSSGYINGHLISMHTVGDMTYQYIDDHLTTIHHLGPLDIIN